MFAEIIKLEKSSKLEWKQRRSLIIVEDQEQNVELHNCYENMKKLRTLIINDCIGIALNSFPQMLQNMKLLRVLVLGWLPDGMEELPNEVGDLIHLRYLDLSCYNKMTRLPDSLGRLHNLQTLDLRETLVNSLPKCVSELKELRHLLGSHRLQVPDIVFTFSQLQTLSGILINTIQARELVNIPQLTKLNIIFKEGDECWRAICDSVKKMTNLRFLSMASDELQEFINFSPPNSLEKLQLFGFGKLVNFISTPNYLCVIYIRMCNVDKDFFNSLGKLPSLLELFIQSYSGDQLVCSEGSFPKLRKLEIVCRKLSKWEIGKGAMTSLESLSMDECKCLEMLPEGLREVEHLKKLHLALHRCRTDAARVFAEIKLSGMHNTKVEWNQRRSLIFLEGERKVNLENVPQMKKLRTLIILECEGIIVNSLPQILKNMKLLRVLALGWLPDGVEELPNEVGDLIHLRYITLYRNYTMRHLPDSLGRLHNLQTLDLKGTSVNSLPKCVSQFMQLRHLFANYNLQVPDIVFTSSQLQTLSGVLINTIQARELLNLTQLTELDIKFMEGEECWRAICDSVNKMANLRSLLIQFGYNRFIKGDGMCYVDGDLLNSLEKLPSLVCLYIDSYSGKQLLCSEGSFPKLKKLEIKCEKLSKWEIGKGAMKCLESLSMRDCYRLQMLPEGLREVEYLKELHLFQPSQQLIQGISVEGSDRWKIEHIPRVTLQNNDNKFGSDFKTMIKQTVQKHRLSAKLNTRLQNL
nr:disease resistance protein RPM1-like [Ipomoea batatas]